MLARSDAKPCNGPAMLLSELDYDLPDHLIAPTPAAQRDASRLLVVDRKTGELTHSHFRELGDVLPDTAHLFRNNVRVLPARLKGRRPSGGEVECLLLHPGELPDTFWCLVKPGRKLRPGDSFHLPDDVTATITETEATSGQRLVQFSLGHYTSVTELAEACGEMPLPPYIERRREVSNAQREQDHVRYQTVYADPSRSVAAAAPTAGLHFTPELIERLEARGLRFHDLTLHVGLGTFQPVKTETVEAHPIHSEFYEIPATTLAQLHQPTQGLRVAVGTTTVRAVEDAFRKGAASGPFQATADCYIVPPATFHATDALITNFHLPRSTLLCLVGAFLSPGKTDGISWLKAIYATAIAHQYRFYSYGDAMLIL